MLMAAKNSTNENDYSQNIQSLNEQIEILTSEKKEIAKKV